MGRHPEIKDQAQQLCGKELIIKKELYPEYVFFVYDSIVTAAKGMEAVLDKYPNATFLYDLSKLTGLLCSEEDMRKELYERIIDVKFEGQSGEIHFKPGVGDRLPVKLEVVNIHVFLFIIFLHVGWSNRGYW